MTRSGSAWVGEEGADALHLLLGLPHTETAWVAAFRHAACTLARRYFKAEIRDVPYIGVMTLNFDNDVIWRYTWEGVFKGVLVSE